MPVSPGILEHLSKQGITIKSSKDMGDGVTIHKCSVERGRGTIFQFSQPKAQEPDSSKSSEGPND
jgi:hypothetical protein